MLAAASLLHDALQRLDALDDRWGPVWALEALAWVAADDGRHEQAAHLLGATQAYLTSIGVRLDGLRPFAAARRRFAAQVREALGESVFSDAFRNGELCTLEETVRDVLGGQLTSAQLASSRLPRDVLAR
jgi:hypothetical protein